MAYKIVAGTNVLHAVLTIPEVVIGMMRMEFAVPLVHTNSVNER